MPPTVVIRADTARPARWRSPDGTEQGVFIPRGRPRVLHDNAVLGASFEAPEHVWAARVFVLLTNADVEADQITNAATDMVQERTHVADAALLVQRGYCTGHGRDGPFDGKGLQLVLLCPAPQCEREAFESLALAVASSAHKASGKATAIVELQSNGSVFGHIGVGAECPLG